MAKEGRDEQCRLTFCSGRLRVCVPVYIKAKGPFCLAEYVVPPFPQGLWGTMMVITYTYNGAHETGWTERLKRIFHQPVKPLAPVVEGEHLGKGDHEENGLLCFCSNRCGLEAGTRTSSRMSSVLALPQVIV